MKFTLFLLILLLTFAPVAYANTACVDSVKTTQPVLNSDNKNKSTQYLQKLNDGTEMKQEQSQLSQSKTKSTVVVAPSQTEKSSMVAEPKTDYKVREPLSSRIVIGGC